MPPSLAGTAFRTMAFAAASLTNSGITNGGRIAALSACPVSSLAGTAFRTMAFAAASLTNSGITNGGRIAALSECPVHFLAGTAFRTSIDFQAGTIF